MSTAANPVVGMVNDPDFQKLGLGDQKRALSGIDNTFGTLSDADFTRVSQGLKTSTPAAVPGAPNGLPAVPNAAPVPQYTGERKFEMNVARGMGLDPQKLAASETSGGNLSALGNIGGQYASGIVSAVPGAVKAIANDPLKALVSPIDAMASNIVKPTGLPDTGSAFNVNNYSKPNPGQLVGALAGTEAVGNIGEGIGEKVVSPLVRWIGSSKAAGAALLQKASATAGNAPVELSPQTNELVEKIATQSKLGGKMPKVISDLLERVGPSTKQPAFGAPNPLTYDEARILQSNASQLSSEEAQQFKGSLKGLLKQFSNSFSSDVQATADKAGVGAEHAAGMKEYATASARNRTLAKGAKIAGIGGAGFMAEQAIRKGIAAVKQ